MPRRQNPASQHTHKYQMVKWGKKKSSVFRCMLPGCPHFIQPELILNRKSICHNCGKPFIVNKYSAMRARPKCSECIRHVVGSVQDVMKNFDDLLADL